MDFEALLEQKNNRFNHIFYEFEMYYHTFNILKRFVDFDMSRHPHEQLCKNILIESHSTHLRNLIHFFSGQDEINANDVLLINPIPNMSRWDEKTKIINNAISHLSEKRVLESTVTNNLSTKLSDLINNEYPQMIERITGFLNALDNNSGISSKYKSDFESQAIQDQYQAIKELYNKASIVVTIQKPVTTC